MEQSERPISGFNGYTITPFGLITRDAKPIQVYSKQSMRNYVAICDDDGVYRHVLVARLVAETYLGKQDGMYVGFKDGNYDNYHLSNLEWVDRGTSYKQRYAFRKKNKLVNDDKRVKALVDSVSKKVYQLDSGMKIVKIYPSLTIAAREMDVSMTAISRSCYNELATCCKFYWCFDYDYPSRKGE